VLLTDGSGFSELICINPENYCSWNLVDSNPPDLKEAQKQIWCYSTAINSKKSGYCSASSNTVSFSSIPAPMSASTSRSSQHQQKRKQQTHRHHIVKHQNCVSQMTSIGSSRLGCLRIHGKKASRRRRRPANSRVVAWRRCGVQSNLRNHASIVRWPDQLGI
jgi:hypothetical protein